MNISVIYWERCILKTAEQRKDKQKSDNLTLLP